MGNYKVDLNNFGSCTWIWAHVNDLTLVDVEGNFPKGNICIFVHFFKPDKIDSYIMGHFILVTAKRENFF